ncbi:MAG: two-component regulator propeller domain-containing protein [bacterium]
MKKYLILFSVFFVAAISSNSFAQYPNWINYTNGQRVEALADNGNELWIGTGGGLVKLDKTTDSMTFYNKANSGLPENVVTAIAVDKNGNKWIGTFVGGLAKFDGTNWTVYNTSNSGLPHDCIDAVAIDNSENIWVATWAGLVKFDGTNWTLYDTSTGLPYNPGSFIAIDDSNNIWTACGGLTTGGLVKFDGTTWVVYDTSNSELPDNSIQTLIIDKNGNKYIGTYKGGLAKFDGTNWTVYDTSNSDLPYNFVGALAVDDDNNIWVGTQEAGLAKFDGTNWTVYDTSNSGLPDNSVRTIAIDSGNIWIGARGLTKFDGVNWKTYDYSNSGLPYDGVSSLAIDKNGNIWVGTVNRGVTIYTGNEGIEENSVSSITRQKAKLEVGRNPFLKSTILSYFIPTKTNVSLTLYDLSGRTVKILVNEEKEAGSYNLNLNAKDLPSGIYFATLATGKYKATQKLVLMK